MKTTIKINWDGSAVVSYAVVSTLLGMFRRSVLRRTVLRRTVLRCTVLYLILGHLLHCSINREHLMGLSLATICNQFVADVASRKYTFGNFIDIDFTSS